MDLREQYKLIKKSVHDPFKIKHSWSYTQNWSNQYSKILPIHVCFTPDKITLCTDKYISYEMGVHFLK